MLTHFTVNKPVQCAISLPFKPLKFLIRHKIKIKLMQTQPKLQ